MVKMTIYVPPELMAFAQGEVSARGMGTISDYLCELIRKDRDRANLRDLLMEGAASASGNPADAKYFDGLRFRVTGSAAS